MERVTQAYMDAAASGILPGASLFAGNINGKTIYSKSLGKASIKEGVELPFTDATVCGIASMGKLMVSVAALRFVEDGRVKLDDDLRLLFNGAIDKYGVFKGFDEKTGAAITEPNTTSITLRMLLTHTSGHGYDWLDPDLGKWRASRNERPWVNGRTVETKTAVPLSFVPGTGFVYGSAHDWVGRVLEITKGSGTLEEIMRECVWEPLGIQDGVSFWPKTKEHMASRMAHIATLNEKGEGPATDASYFDLSGPPGSCFGGSGIFCSPAAYNTFLTAVADRDKRLLRSATFDELFRPQLDEKCEQSLNDLITSAPIYEQAIGMNIPRSTRRNWCFAGAILKEGHDGRFAPGTVTWGGLTCSQWFIDFKSGTYGSVLCQMLPPLCPSVMILHEKFQRAVHDRTSARL
ncbi:beta-lactamase/transpeptidase-like protein [Xylariaceae sp. FL0255]|nr:beta-lactamase/transpeptidase-like protein [Xylariaceae sp. FL0255]